MTALGAWLLRATILNRTFWVIALSVLALGVVYTCLVHHGEQIQAKKDQAQIVALTQQYTDKLAAMQDSYNKRLAGATAATTVVTQYAATVDAQYKTAVQHAKDLADENNTLRRRELDTAMRLSTLAPARPSPSVGNPNAACTTDPTTDAMFCDGAHLYQQDQQFLIGFANDDDIVRQDDLQCRSMYKSLVTAVNQMRVKITEQCDSLKANGSPLADQACAAVTSVSPVH